MYFALLTAKMFSGLSSEFLSFSCLCSVLVKVGEIRFHIAASAAACLGPSALTASTQEPCLSMLFKCLASS